VAPPYTSAILLAFGAGLACAQQASSRSVALNNGPSLNNLGVELRLASRPADAILQFNAAIQIAESSGDDRLLAAALGGLGSSLADQGEFVRAEPVLRRSLALFEKTTGSDSLETGEAANNLAMVYRKNGDLAQAEAQLDRALRLMQKSLDPHSVELEIAFNNMFIVLAEQKRWDRAEPYVLHALEIAQALPESVDRADVEENLALLQAHRNQFQEAAQTMQQVIAIEERTLQPDDPRLARSLDSYAGYLRKIRQKSEAERAEQRARIIRRAAVAP
jgi:Tfp pilus assembly protein PilF